MLLLMVEGSTAGCWLGDGGWGMGGTDWDGGDVWGRTTTDAGMGVRWERGG